MKRITLFTLALFVSSLTSLTADAALPKAMDYNLMLINPQTGLVMTNKTANLRLELRQNSQNGTAVWSQDYNVTSDATGMVHITLDFSENIDWDAAEYYLAMLVDNKEAGAAKLMSVPYAFVSERLSNVLTKEELIGTWTFGSEVSKGSDNAVFTFNDDGTGYRNSEKGDYAITWHISPSGSIHYSYYNGDREYTYVYPSVKLSSTKIAWNNGYLIKK